MVLVTACLLTTAVVLILAYSRWRHSYWEKRGVNSAPNYLPLFGHLLKFLSKKEPAWMFLDKVYRNHSGSTYCGLYDMLSALLLIGDPDLIKTVFIKDFDHFVDRTNIQLSNKSEDSLFNELLTIAQGSHWKGIRSVVSPSFTSGRMKGLFPLVAQKAECLVGFLSNNSKNNSPVELKKTFGNYSMETIASCAFGMDTNAFEDDNAEFTVQASELTKFKLWPTIKAIAYMICPKICNALKLTVSQKELFFFRDVVMASIKQRDTGLYRGDFLDLMLQTREDQSNPNSKASKYPLKDDTIVAQSVLFILAGYETVANTLSFVAFLLAKHPEIQQKLRTELRDSLGEGEDGRKNEEHTYQEIMEAKYLDAVISEALRMYPTVTSIQRICTRDYTLPGTDINIPKEMTVIAPVYSLHHDERFWPEPEEFRPERFLPENKDDIKSGTYLPFGIGPRNCIGMRFALMETKIAIAKMILTFELSCIPGDEEMRLNKTPGMMRPADDLSIIYKNIT